MLTACGSPRDYIHHHLHLAYASTVHGVQGETADHAPRPTDNTPAAAAYVGLTRDRYTLAAVVVLTWVFLPGTTVWQQPASPNDAER